MRLILKLGGSVITRKDGYREANVEKIEEIAGIIAEHWEKWKGKLIIVSGAGSFGHAVVLKYDINNGVESETQKVGFAETHVSCTGLALLIADKLIAKGVPAVPLFPICMVKQNGKKIASFNLSQVERFLKRGYLPILYGTMVEDESLGESVVSGDRIIALLAKEGDVVAFGSDVDGVLADGKVIPEISPSNLDEVSSYLGGREKDVTGGMMGKIREIMSMKAKEVYIFNLSKPERLEELLKEGKTKGTLIITQSS